MRDVLGAVILSMLMAACSNASKIETICTDIVKSVATDPGGLKINSIKLTGGVLDAISLTRLFNERYPDGITESGKAFMALRKEEIGKSRDQFVEVDYTASERLGVVRDRALCRYFEWRDGDVELVSLTLRNKDYGQRDFLDIFLRYGRPDGLSVINKVE